MSDIYAKISVYEIKIGTLDAPLIFHQQIIVMNDSHGELLTTGKIADISCKIVVFINVYTSSLIKSSCVFRIDICG